MSKLMTVLTALLVLVAAAGCVSPTAAPAASARTTLVVATHDSFAVSEEVVAAFEEANNATVQFLALGDAGAALNKVILSKESPLADVFYGVDNTLL